MTKADDDRRRVFVKRAAGEEANGLGSRALAQTGISRSTS